MTTALLNSAVPQGAVAATARLAAAQAGEPLLANDAGASPAR